MFVYWFVCVYIYIYTGAARTSARAPPRRATVLCLRSVFIISNRKISN